MQSRKRRGQRYDTWHWHPECHLYPTTDYVPREKFPTSGERRNHCKRRDNGILAEVVGDALRK